MTQGRVDFGLRDFGIWTGQYRGGLALCGFDQLTVPNEVGHLKTGHSGLARAEEFSRAAELQIKFRNLESVVGAHHSVEAAFCIFGNFASGHENAVRFRCAAADAAAKLMK